MTGTGPSELFGFDTSFDGLMPSVFSDGDPSSARKRKRPISPQDALSQEPTHLAQVFYSNEPYHEGDYIESQADMTAHMSPIAMPNYESEAMPPPRARSSSQSCTSLFPNRLLSSFSPSLSGFSEQDAIACTNVELFLATSTNENDSEFHGLIGIRCIHCKKDNNKNDRYAKVYPAAISHIPSSAKLVMNRHLSFCPMVPEKILDRYQQATYHVENFGNSQERTSAVAFDEYCNKLCKDMNVVNHPASGITLSTTHQNAPVPVPAPTPIQYVNNNNSSEPKPSVMQPTPSPIVRCDPRQPSGRSGFYSPETSEIYRSKISNFFSPDSPFHHMSPDNHNFDPFNATPIGADEAYFIEEPSPTAIFNDPHLPESNRDRSQKQFAKVFSFDEVETPKGHNDVNPIDLIHQPQPVVNKAVEDVTHAFYQDSYGYWICRKCHQVPLHYRAAGALWQHYDPPPRMFIEEHLRVCTHNNHNYRNHGPPPRHNYNNAHQSNAHQWETPGKHGHPAMSSYPNNSNGYSPYPSNQHPRFVSPPVPSPRLRAPSYRYHQHQQQQHDAYHGHHHHYREQPPYIPNIHEEYHYYRNAPPVSQHPVSQSTYIPPEDNYDSNSQASKAIHILMKADIKRKEEKKRQGQNADSELLVEGDKMIVTEYLYFMIKQLEVCHFTEIDRKTRGGKRHNIELGFSGLQCVHCACTPQARKFFWANADRLATSFAEISSHIQKCKACPQPIKDAIKILKECHPDRMTQMPHGSQKLFFRKMWSRLHKDDPTKEDDNLTVYSSDTKYSNEPIPVISQTNACNESSNEKKVAEPATGKLICKDVGACSPTITKSTENTRKALQQRVSSQPSKSSEFRILLAIKEDKIYLSENDLFIRENLEVFCASSLDVDATSRDNKYPIVAGQIGLRCVHCAMSGNGPIVRGNAVCFPHSISSIYESVREMQTIHLETCPNLPPQLRETFSKLRSKSSSLTSELRKYYTWAAQALGMYDTTEGIRVVEDEDNVVVTPNSIISNRTDKDSMEQDHNATKVESIDISSTPELKVETVCLDPTDVNNSSSEETTNNIQNDSMIDRKQCNQNASESLLRNKKHIYALFDCTDMKLNGLKRIILNEIEKSQQPDGRDADIKRILVFCDPLLPIDIMADSIKSDLCTLDDCGEIVVSALSECDNEDAIESFRCPDISGTLTQWSIRVLLVTDLSSRKLTADDNISHVINFDLPCDGKTYQERGSFVGRYNDKGTVLSLATADEQQFLLEIVSSRLGIELKCISRQKMKRDKPPLHKQYI